MQETGERSVDNTFAGSTAVRLIDSAIGDIGHTFFQEVFHDITQDIRDELNPKAVLGEIFDDLSVEFEDLKPSALIKSVILGK